MPLWACPTIPAITNFAEELNSHDAWLAGDFSRLGFEPIPKELRVATDIWWRQR